MARDKRGGVDFISCLNNNVQNIHLTHFISETAVEYLDLRLAVDSKTIHSSLFRKSTTSNNLLQFSSFHSHHVFLKAKPNSSDHRGFKSQVGDPAKWFVGRGYPSKIV
ncbi:hypothetical protein GDO78_015674 [Eleutherodactylus coqui]|uniref:Uncharacterized protein n=1 Tax=Eleutherodactylus coqui TaxID=57060 RepID=A0A8J6EDE8_ELECQ|nr:hypothetical protein GDO78_015674 [Eleutherodactylus coqui]